MNTEWIQCIAAITGGGLVLALIIKISVKIWRLPKYRPGREETQSLYEAFTNFNSGIGDGTGSGFILALVTMSREDGSTPPFPGPLEETFALFKLRNNIKTGQFQDSKVYDMGLWGPIPSAVILIGNPIRMDSENQTQTIKKLLRSWYAYVDELSNGLRKGLASISYGQIIFSKPKVIYQPDRGTVMGSAFEHAVVAVGDAYCREKWFNSVQCHKIAVDCEAAKKLAIQLPEFEMVSSEDPLVRMYAGDYREGMLKSQNTAR